ncbi:hypothetical protein GQ42DRAFT_179743 [Ramicandelaber brevisporus]|nr:hypothetical protein GQ42DRAFT_179743 [Ramicandelaber brevisporus]
MADARQQQKLTARQRGAGRDGLHGVKDRQFVIRTDANLERQRSPLAQIEPPAEQLHDNERQASGQASRQEYQQSRQQSEPILVANETHEAAHPIQQTQPTRRIEASAPSRLPDPMHPRRVAPRQRGAERADRHQVVDRNFTIQTAARLPRNVISPEPQKLERDTTASSQSSAPMSLVSPSPTPVISSQPSSQSASQRPSRVSSVQPLQTNTISSRMTSPMYGSGHTSSLQRYTSPPPPAMTPFRAARYGSLRTQSPLPVLSAASTPAMDNRTAASLSTDDTVPAHGVVEASPGILSYEILESPVTHFDEHSTVDASRAEPLGESFTVAADSDDNDVARVPETSPAAVSHERKQSMSPLAAMQRESPQPVDVPAEPELTLQQEDDAEPEERPLKQRRVDGPKTQFRFHRLSNDATGQSLTVFDIVASHIDDIISRQLILRYNGDGGGGSGGDMSGIEEIVVATTLLTDNKVHCGTNSSSSNSQYSVCKTD